MEHRRFVSLVTASIFVLRTASGQAFTNLNFERARIVPDPSSPYYPYAVYASDAVPGWTVGGFLGPNELFYNDISLGAPSVSLFGTNSQFSLPPLAGSFSIDLYGGVPASGYPTVGGSISQTGLVPISAQSLQFKASGLGGPLSVSLGGQNIPFYVLSAGTNYTLFGGDVSVFASQVEPLTFTAPFNTGINNYWEIDDIQFSPTPIPEPHFSGLLLCGLLLCSHRFTKQFWVGAW
jgi:hypothetical protein